MAIVVRDRPMIDWPMFGMPDRWRRWLSAELEHEGWLKVEEFRDGDMLVLRTEMPGIDPDKDVEISVTDGVLTFRVHREQKSETKEKRGFRTEFQYGEFSRSIQLPANASSDDVKATYTDGVLEVRVPMPPEGSPETVTVPVTRT
jgi:HSP20 family protein